MTVNDNTIQAKCLGDFFMKLGKKDLLLQGGWHEREDQPWIIGQTLLVQLLLEALKRL